MTPKLSLSILLMLGAPISQGGELRPGLDRSILFTADPQTLTEVTQREGGLGGFLCSDKPESNTSNFQLERDCSTYHDLVSTLESDLDRRAELMAEHRWHIEFDQTLFSKDLFKSKETQFVLIGAVARPDDESLPGQSKCGEMRFIFRLFGKDVGKIGDTFMPATIMVAYRPREDSNCRDWLKNLQPWSTANLLKLKKTMTPLRVEVNLQTHFIRSRYQDLALGQAQYLMRIFVLDDGKIYPDKLKNTPVVQRLLADQNLRDELLDWIADNKALVASGIIDIPDKFLDTSAISVAPYGLSRLANRPFRQLFDEKSLVSRGIPDLDAKYILRRLDSMTCQGCHQSKSVAGFHFLGRNQKITGYNSTMLPYSTHFLGIQSWRQQHLTNRRVPTLPFPERAQNQTAKNDFGISCNLKSDSKFSWGCPKGLKCSALEAKNEDYDDGIGVCTPVIPVPAQHCENIVLRSFSDSFLDFRDLLNEISCDKSRNQYCAPSLFGFPGGQCVGRCDKDDKNYACVKVPISGPFDACLNSNKHFSECLKTASVSDLLQKCDLKNPCRSDYVCSATDNPKFGVCVPTYVLPQFSLENIQRKF